MSSIEYSLDALNAINLFHKVDVMVYVEGDDDIMFWDIIFNLQSSQKVKIQGVGGSPTLDKYMSSVIDGTMNSIIARDSDYYELLNIKSIHPRVIYSYGYSIENTLFAAEEAHEICKVSCRKPDLDFESFLNWYNTFLAAMSNLLIHDLANEFGKSGMAVMSDNCSRFMLNENSHIPCPVKIASHIDLIKNNLPKYAKNYATLAGLQSLENINRWIRGHFLMSAIQKFICYQLKELQMKANLSFEQLYTNSIFQLKASIGNSHPHREHYINSIALATNTFT